MPRTSITKGAFRARLLAAGALALAAFSAPPLARAEAQPAAQATTCSIWDRYLRSVLEQRVQMGDYVVDVDRAITDELADTLATCREANFGAALERYATLLRLLEGPEEAASARELARR